MELKHNALDLLNLDIDSFLEYLGYETDNIIEAYKTEKVNGDFWSELIEHKFKIEKYKIQSYSLEAYIHYDNDRVEVKKQNTIIEQNKFYCDMLNEYLSLIDMSIYKIENLEKTFKSEDLKQKETEKKIAAYQEKRKNKRKRPGVTSILGENEVAKFFMCLMNLKFVTSRNHTEIGEVINIITGYGKHNMTKNIGNNKNFNSKEKENILDFVAKISEKINKMPTTD